MDKLLTAEERKKQDDNFKEFVLCLALAILGFIGIPYIMDFMAWILGY